MDLVWIYKKSYVYWSKNEIFEEAWDYVVNGFVMIRVRKVNEDLFLIIIYEDSEEDCSSFLARDSCSGTPEYAIFRAMLLADNLGLEIDLSDVEVSREDVMEILPINLNR